MRCAISDLLGVVVVARLPLACTVRHASAVPGIAAFRGGEGSTPYSEKTVFAPRGPPCQDDSFSLATFAVMWHEEVARCHEGK
jgi:hypothetical protein